MLAGILAFLDFFDTCSSSSCEVSFAFWVVLRIRNSEFRQLQFIINQFGFGVTIELLLIFFFSVELFVCGDSVRNSIPQGHLQALELHVVFFYRIVGSKRDDFNGFLIEFGLQFTCVLFSEPSVFEFGNWVRVKNCFFQPIQD